MRREDILYELALKDYQTSFVSLKDKEKRLYDLYKVKECPEHEFEEFKSMFHGDDLKTEKCKLFGYVNAERKQREIDYE